ncbi:MAG: 3-beta hydroxysteroid dehydrogenase [Thalassobius sp.]|nr:3-beta hydroxysteroid dehydrogenase [Thalassovita sp.]
MKVFVTGGTGFIGTAIVEQLIENGHEVLGLARSQSSADKLIAAGAAVHHGDLTDLDSIRKGAELADGVIHAGFIHDFSRFKEVCEIDGKVLNAFGEVLKGTKKPLITASGTMMISPGELITEDMKVSLNESVHPRIITELTADKLADQGVHVSCIRLAPFVHGDKDYAGFTRIFIATSKQKQLAAYIGDGQNRWPAIHYKDAAKLFRLALEKNMLGMKVHAVENEGMTFKTIAEKIGERLNIPVQSISAEMATEHYGFLGSFAVIDAPASNNITRNTFNWEPENPTWLEDMDQDFYFN